MTALQDNEAKRTEIEAFLKAFREATGGQRPIVVDRQKNQATLIELGITLNEQAGIILGLTPGNYVSGPESDRVRRGSLWVFGYEREGIELYIKLKIAEYTIKATGEPVRQAVCISFHKAECQLWYPLKTH